MKAIPAIILVSIASLAAGPGHGQTGEQKPPPGNTATAASVATSITITRASDKSAFGSHLAPILKTVSATEDQRKSITAIVEEFKGRIVPLRKRHDELRDEFFKTLTSDQSGDKVLAAQTEFIRVQSDLNAQYLALRLKISQVLTEEQNEKFAEYRKKQGWKSK